MLKMAVALALPVALLLSSACDAQQESDRQKGLPPKADRPALQEAYRAELGKSPRPCSRKTASSRLDVSQCDVFGLKLYTPFDEVKKRVERSGFFHSREARSDNTEFLAWGDDFNLTMKFVQIDPANKSSMVLYHVEMYIDAGRKSARRLDAGFEDQLVEKYGPTPDRFSRWWGAEYGKGPNVTYSGGLLRLEDKKFFDESEAARRRHRDNQKPIVKPPL